MTYTDVLLLPNNNLRKSAELIPESIVEKNKMIMIIFKTEGDYIIYEHEKCMKYIIYCPYAKCKL